MTEIVIEIIDEWISDEKGHYVHGAHSANIWYVPVAYAAQGCTFTLSKAL